MILLELFIVFFTIGLFTFGGGYAMIPLMQQMLTEKGWVSSSDITNFIAISESTPGVFAVNMATFTGFRMGGIIGAICSTIGVVLPSIIIITIIALFVNKIKKNKYVNGFQQGIRPIVIGLIISVCLTFAYNAFFPNGFNNENFIFNFDVFLISMLVLALRIKYKNISPIILIIVGALLGMMML